MTAGRGSTGGEQQAPQTAGMKPHWRRNEREKNVFEDEDRNARHERNWADEWGRRR